MTSVIRSRCRRSSTRTAICDEEKKNQMEVIYRLLFITGTRCYLRVIVLRIVRAVSKSIEKKKWRSAAVIENTMMCTKPRLHCSIYHLEYDGDHGVFTQKSFVRRTCGWRNSVISFRVDAPLMDCRNKRCCKCIYLLSFVFGHTR